MKTSQITVRSLADAQRHLQEIYARLGAPATQNIRNVEPAHMTLVKCLPTKERDSVTANTLWERFKEQGGLITRNSFNSILSTMVQSNKVNTIQYSNAPFKHYYFGMK